MKLHIRSAVPALLLMAALPAVSFAENPTAAQQNKATRKVYYSMVTGSNVAVPIARVRGHVATTSDHVRTIKINERNRLQAPEFWYGGSVVVRR